MQISAPETPTASRPYAKLNDIGDTLVIAIGHIDKNIPERDYDTDEIKTWDDGNPITQTRIVGVVLSTSGNVVGRMNSENVILEDGDEVAIFVSGGKNGNQGRFKDAERELGGVELCDVLQWKFDRTEAASNPKWNDRKIYTCAMRKAKPEELAAHKDACEEIYRGFQDLPQLSAPPAAGVPVMSGAAVADAFGAEDPFCVSTHDWMPGVWGTYPTNKVT